MNMDKRLILNILVIIFAISIITIFSYNFTISNLGNLINENDLLIKIEKIILLNTIVTSFILGFIILIIYLRLIKSFNTSLNNFTSFLEEFLNFVLLKRNKIEKKLLTNMMTFIHLHTN